MGEEFACNGSLLFESRPNWQNCAIDTHTMEDVKYTLDAFKEIRDKQKMGLYEEDEDKINAMVIE